MMKRILVVDDSATILKYTEDVLKTKYHPIPVKSGELALAYLAEPEHQVDMILLDVFMPKMDGFETYEKILEMESVRDVPVVFVTSGEEAEIESRALAMGAKDFIRKPFIPAVMLNRIQNILDLDELTRSLEKKVEEKTQQVEQLSFEIIEIALKKTTSKANPNFDYLDKLLTDWHDREFKTEAEIQNFLSQLKQKKKEVKELEKKTGYQNYEQRKYDNLDSLYANFNL